MTSTQNPKPRRIHDDMGELRLLAQITSERAYRAELARQLAYGEPCFTAASAERYMEQVARETFDRSLDMLAHNQ